MERLTEKSVGCFEYALKDHKAVPGEFGTYDAFFDYSMAVKRLGHYEDSGLEPEEIKELRELCTDEVAELARTLYKAMESGKLDHLRDILQADQDGRIPPCKRGDVVYCIRHNPCIGYYVKTLTVCTVTIWEPGRFSVFTTKEDELGKTAFLDREEAEMALKGGEG